MIRLFSILISVFLFAGFDAVAGDRDTLPETGQATVPTAAADGTDLLWDNANTAYINANYIDAIKGYESILSRGLESDKLYFNLGNAYFKRGSVGKAILNYHRALRLAPADEDVLYNLSIAGTQVQDKIDVVPVFFVKRWFQNMRGSLSGNAWAGLSLLFFALTLAGIALYLLMQNVRMQKAGFFGAAISCILLVCCLVFAGISRKETLRPSEAVVMSRAATVKSSPDKESKDIFVLHEGTKVAAGEVLGTWQEITLSDGNKGWIARSAIELID